MSALRCVISDGHHKNKCFLSTLLLLRLSKEVKIVYFNLLALGLRLSQAKPVRPVQWPSFETVGFSVDAGTTQNHNAPFISRAEKACDIVKLIVEVEQTCKTSEILAVTAALLHDSAIVVHKPEVLIPCENAYLAEISGRNL